MACEDLKIKLGGNSDCFTNSSSAIENGKKFIFKNTKNKTICKVRIDDCLIKDKTIKKCDYLFQVEEDNRYYLVELKGQSIDVAVEQITSTYKILEPKIKSGPLNYTGVIVSSAVPKAANQKFKNLQDRIYRDKKLIIKRKQIHYEEIV